METATANVRIVKAIAPVKEKAPKIEKAPVHIRIAALDSNGTMLLETKAPRGAVASYTEKQSNGDLIIRGCSLQVNPEDGVQELVLPLVIKPKITKAKKEVFYIFANGTQERKLSSGKARKGFVKQEDGNFHEVVVAATMTETPATVNA